MRRTGLLFAMLGSYGLPSVLMAAIPFGVGYRETWDTYATGNADSTYTSVWSAYAVTAGTAGNPTYAATTDGPSVQTAASMSTPNSLAWRAKNYTLVNNLTDGIVNPTQPPTSYGELSAGQVIKPDSTIALDDTRSASNYTNLQLRTYMGFGSGTQRVHSGQYAELSYGDIHAPALTGALTPLASPINVIALGKLPGGAAGSFGAVGNTNAYFFDGQQWNSLGSIAVANGTNSLVAKIFYSGLGVTGWQVRIDYISGAAGSTATTRDLKFDPTVLGFNTISNNLMNGGTNPSGSPLPYYDDIWVAGGLVVPEPTTVGLLAIGALMLRRRRR